jgi:hypothetical protein
VGDPVDDCLNRADKTKECPWLNQRSDKWSAGVKAMEWLQQDSRTWVKSGNCPRCGHIMMVRHESHVPFPAITDAAVKEAAKTGRGAPVPVNARCNCTVDHTGHPLKPDDAVWGCGMHGSVPFPNP